MVAQNLLSDQLEEHTLHLRPQNILAEAYHCSFLFTAKLKSQIHAIGSGGHIGFVQEVGKEAGSAQRNTSSKPRRLQGGPLHSRIVEFINKRKGCHQVSR